MQQEIKTQRKEEMKMENAHKERNKTVTKGSKKTTRM
jgi:hypothetical protein